MGEEVKKKKKEIIQKTSETINTYDDTIKVCQKSKGQLDDIQQILIKEKDKLIKTGSLWSLVPDEFDYESSPSMMSMICSSEELIRDTEKHAITIKAKSIDIAKDIDSHSLYAMSSGSTTTSNMYIASSLVDSVIDNYPYLREKFEVVKVPTPYEKKEKAQTLLKEVDQRISEEYDEVWRIRMDENRKTRCILASHLMREIISELLQNLAPDEKVMVQEWYVKETLNGRPSQKQRTRYAIIGESKDIFEENIEPILTLAQNLRNRYETLNKIAHTRKDEDEEMLRLLDTCLDNSQELIINLLELRKKYFKNMF
jgi:hypothetical protein